MTLIEGLLVQSSLSGGHPGEFSTSEIAIYVGARVDNRDIDEVGRGTHSEADVNDTTTWNGVFLVDRGCWEALMQKLEHSIYNQGVTNRTHPRG